MVGRLFWSRGPRAERSNCSSGRRASIGAMLPRDEGRQLSSPASLGRLVSRFLVPFEVDGRQRSHDPLTRNGPASPRPLCGMVLGLVGVVIFGAALPVIKLAIVDFSPGFVATGHDSGGACRRGRTGRAQTSHSPVGRNAGLAVGGIARASQVQLLQSFVTLGVAAMLLGQRISPTPLLFAAAVACAVWMGRRARIG